MQEAIQQARRDLVEFGVVITERPYTRFNSMYDNYLQRVLTAKTQTLNALIRCDLLLPLELRDNGIRNLCQHTLMVLTETLNYKNHYGNGNPYGIPLDYKDHAKQVMFPNNNVRIHGANGNLNNAIQTNQDPVTIGQLIFDAHRAATMSMALVFRFWLQSIICLVHADVDVDRAEENEAMEDLLRPYFNATTMNTVPECLKNISSFNYNNQPLNPYTLINHDQVNPLPANFPLARYYPILWRAGMFFTAFPFDNTGLGAGAQNPRTKDPLLNIIQDNPLFIDHPMIFDDTNYRQEIYDVSKEKAEYAGRPESVNSGVQVLQNNGDGYNIRDQEEIQILRRTKKVQQKHIFQFFDICMQRSIIQEMLAAIGELNTFVDQAVPGNAHIDAIIQTFTRFDGRRAPRNNPLPIIPDPNTTPRSCLHPVNQDLLTWDTSIVALEAAPHNLRLWTIPTNGIVFRPTDENGRFTRNTLSDNDAVWIDMDVWRTNTHFPVFNTQRSVLYVGEFSKFIKMLTYTIDYNRRVGHRTIKNYLDKVKRPNKTFVHPASWAMGVAIPIPPGNEWTLVQKRMRFAGQIITLPQPPAAGAGNAAPQPAFNGNYHRPD